MPRRSPRVNPSVQTSAMPSPQSRGDQRTEQPRVLIARELFLDNLKACCFPDRGSWEVRGTGWQCLSSKGFGAVTEGASQASVPLGSPEPAERLRRESGWREEGAKGPGEEVVQAGGRKGAPYPTSPLVQNHPFCPFPVLQLHP